MESKDSNQQQEVQQDMQVQEQNVQEQSLNDSASSNSSTTKKKKKKKAIAGIIILFMVLAIGGGASYLYLGGNKDNNSNTNKSESDAKGFYSTYRISSNALEKFDLEFLKLENSEKNKIYSPLSIKFALQMLRDGSEGSSKEQLDAIIGDYKPVRYANNEHMSFANAMFVRNSFANSIKDDYKTKLSNTYNAEVIEDSFENANTLNNWVNNKTFKLIDSLVDDASIKELDFVLVNALAIDMNWKNLIQCANVKTDIPCIKYSVSYKHENYFDYVSAIMGDQDYPAMTFNGNENIKSVKIGASFNNYDIVKDLGRDNIYNTISTEYQAWLDKGECGPASNFPDAKTYTDKYIEEINSNYKNADVSSDFMIYNDDDVKIFAKDLQEYSGITLQYVGIMPKNQNLTDFVKEASPGDLEAKIDKLKELKAENFKDGVVTKIKGNIPLFKFDYELSLQDDLQKMGVTDIFDINKANLGGMLTEGKKEYIQKASHKANIEFSNEGIKAAAATAIGGAGSAGCYFEHLYDVPVEEIDMTFDKPYMFIIKDKASGEVWFTGTVYEPLTK